MNDEERIRKAREKIERMLDGPHLAAIADYKKPLEEVMKEYREAFHREFGVYPEELEE